MLHFFCPPLTERAGYYRGRALKKIGILYHPKVPATRTKAREIAGFLKNRGISSWAGSAWEKEKARVQVDGADLLITVGGDGTILRAVQVAIQGSMPILSVNLGNLGFMTELLAGEVLIELPDILDGKGWIDERAMLQTEMINASQPPQIFHALNDVVVARGEVARLIRVKASINEQLLTTYRADGVIVATATGSTGYALATQGPVLHPQAQDLLLTPVAPHFSLAFPLVLPVDSVVELELDTYLSATLSVDGHINLPLANGDTVAVRRSPHTTRFLRVRSGDSFYSSLEEKLKGK